MNRPQIGRRSGVGVITSDYGFKSVAELTGVLGMPVIGNIPRSELVTNRSSSIGDSAFEAAIDRLRIGVGMADSYNDDNVIQLTSTRSGEGKSTIAIALCASASQAGLRVLLIDTSIRDPKLSRSLGVFQGPGLSDVLRGEMNAAAVIRRCERFDGYLLPAVAGGGVVVDILGSGRLGPLIVSLKTSFDYIIVDSPPSDLAIDPFIVAGHTDKLIYVVRYGYVQQKAVRYSLRQLSKYNLIDGIVFNCVE